MQENDESASDRQMATYDKSHFCKFLKRVSAITLWRAMRCRKLYMLGDLGWGRTQILEVLSLAGIGY